MDSNFTQSRRLFAHTGGLDRVASLLKVAPLPMLNQSDAQTEDGHAMMKSDTFHSFRNLSQRVCVGLFALRNTCAKDTSDRELCAHAVRGYCNNCRQRRANVKTHVYVSPKTGREVVS